MRYSILLLALFVINSTFSQSLDSSFFSTEIRKTKIYGEHTIAKEPITTSCIEITKEEAERIINLLEINAIGYCAREVEVKFKTDWDRLHNLEINFYLLAINNVKENIHYLNNNSVPKTVEVISTDLKPITSIFENTPKSFNRLYIYQVETGSPNIKKFGFISDYDISRRFEFSKEHKIEVEKRAELEELLMEEYSNN
jgi:hypothetical protein